MRYRDGDFIVECEDQTLRVLLHEKEPPNSRSLHNFRRALGRKLRVGTNRIKLLPSGGAIRRGKLTLFSCQVPRHLGKEEAVELVREVIVEMARCLKSEVPQPPQKKERSRPTNRRQGAFAYGRT